jgi:ribosomal protein S27AE
MEGIEKKKKEKKKECVKTGPTIVARHAREKTLSTLHHLLLF